VAAEYGALQECLRRSEYEFPWVCFRARNHLGRSVVSEQEKDLRELCPTVGKRADPDVVN
jgi:hypothetical protein